MSTFDEEPTELDVFDESDNEDFEQESSLNISSKKKTDNDEDVNDNDDANEDDDDDEIDDGANEDDDSDEGSVDDDNEEDIIENTQSTQKNLFNIENIGYNDESDESDDDENYLQKFNENLSKNIIDTHYPEYKQHNYDEIDVLSKVIRNDDNIIIDPLHKTIPIMTRYERASIIGQRAKQLDSGAIPFIDLEPNEIDSYYIAQKEFDQKKIPFIIKRPLPNGSCEYWKIKDLEVL